MLGNTPPRAMVTPGGQISQLKRLVSIDCSKVAALLKTTPRQRITGDLQVISHICILKRRIFSLNESKYVKIFMKTFCL